MKPEKGEGESPGSRLEKGGKMPLPQFSGGWGEEKKGEFLAPCSTKSPLCLRRLKGEKRERHRCRPVKHGSGKTKANSLLLPREEKKKKEPTNVSNSKI